MSFFVLKTFKITISKLVRQITHWKINFHDEWTKIYFTLEKTLKIYSGSSSPKQVHLYSFFNQCERHLIGYPCKYFENNVQLWVLRGALFSTIFWETQDWCWLCQFFGNVAWPIKIPTKLNAQCFLVMSAASPTWESICQ